MKKVLTYILGTAVLLLFLVGCGKSSAKDYSNSTITGQVTAVDGSSVNLLLGEMTTGDAAAAPSGDSASRGAPSGQAPSGGGSMASFTTGTDSATIAITDSAVITVDGMGESTTGTIADITVGAILEVTFGDDNTVTAITVKNIGG